MRADSRASIGCVSLSSRGRCVTHPIRQFGAWQQVALATIRAGFGAFGPVVLLNCGASSRSRYAGTNCKRSVSLSRFVSKLPEFVTKQAFSMFRHRIGLAKTWLRPVALLVAPLPNDIGSQQLLRLSWRPFTTLERAVISELHKFFRPELIGRFDEKILFKPLSGSSREGNAGRQQWWRWRQ